MLKVEWQGRAASFWRSQAVSLVLCSGVAFLMLTRFGATGKPNEKPIQITYAPDLRELSPKVPPSKDLAHGGGGGGKHSISTVTKGEIPKFTRYQLAPPSLPHNPHPELVAEASLLGIPDIQLPSPSLDRFGSPMATLISDSEGPGKGGGMGSGDGTGLGDGEGPGYRPGNGGGFGGDVFRPGRGVGYPMCAYCPDAKYSDQARKAKFQGLVVLTLVVLPDGRPSGIEVVSSPGLGLDEEAVKAVSNWRFKPAVGPDRRPVATQISIELRFRLL